MSRQYVHMSQRELDRLGLIQKTTKKELTGVEAARLLCLSYRQFKRLKARFKQSGAAGLVHGHRGKAGNRRIPHRERERIKGLLLKHYHDFKPSFATEKLAERHGIERDPKTIGAIMIAEGLWKVRRGRQRGQHRQWRARRDLLGELVQFDGSYEYWFEDRAGKCCLLLAIDDATGAVTASFAEHEGVFPVFAFWQEYISEHGKPRAIYTDKFSTYSMNQKLAKENPDTLTQFERAMKRLDIKVIKANSPEAKGRVERVFGTLQDRLIKELRLAGISTMEEANRFLKEDYLPKFNAKFSVAPTGQGDLHRHLTTRESKELDSIFSRHETRTVRNDFTVSFQNRWFQLTRQQPATVCKGDQVTVEQHPDGSLKMRLRGKYLNLEELPERPKRSKDQPWVLAKTAAIKPPWKPAADHSWRTCVPLNSLTGQTVKKGHF